MSKDSDMDSKQSSKNSKNVISWPAELSRRLSKKKKKRKSESEDVSQLTKLSEKGSERPLNADNSLKPEIKVSLINEEDPKNFKLKSWIVNRESFDVLSIYDKIGSNRPSLDYSAKKEIHQYKKYWVAVHKLLDSKKDDNNGKLDSIDESADELDDKYKGLFFNDGKRLIDFVLVYEEKKIPDKERNENEKMKEYCRKKFLMGLLKAGIELERATRQTDTAKINFIKLHLPFEVLCAYAEHLNLPAPIKEYEKAQKSTQKAVSELWLDKIYGSINLKNPHDMEVPNQPKKYFTCPFKAEKLNKFYGALSPSRDVEFFTATQRSFAVHQILKTTSYGRRKRGEVGIEQLLALNVFSSAYPLHDYDLKDLSSEPKDKNSETAMRPILYDFWACMKRWYKYQPLDHIKQYFGEKIGFYFAWLGFYTTFLIPAAFVGVLVFIYGLVTLDQDIIVKEVCKNGNHFRMCSLCTECKSYNLSEMCPYMRFGYLSDNPGTVFYSVFMSFWAILFLQFWERKTARIAFEWDCLDYNDLEERPRAEYMNLATERLKNPITGLIEPHFPKSVRTKRKFVSCSFILFMMAVVIVFILAVIVYRGLVSLHLIRTAYLFGPLSQFSSYLVSGTATLANLVLVFILGYIYTFLAEKMTHWEMHRTQSEFDDSYSIKVFVFQFVNYFSSMFYIGFFKGKFTGYPGHYWKALGLRNEECTVGNCMNELALQLFIFMAGIQLFNNLTEFLLPRIQSWWLNRSNMLKKAMKETNTAIQRWEQDHQLLICPGLFDEYLEMVLQFGFITIFVAACPLAPLLALINNIAELRLDAKKLVCVYRRPVVARASDIGVWHSILRLIAHIAVISNAFLIAFTSEFLEKQFYKYTIRRNMVGYVNFTLSTSHHNSAEPCMYKGFQDSSGNFTETYWKLLAIKLIFVVTFEHFVFGVMRLIDYVVPDIPEHLHITIKKEQYLAKQALAANETSLLMAKHEEDIDEEDEVSEGENL